MTPCPTCGAPITLQNVTVKVLDMYSTESIDKRIQVHHYDEASILDQLRAALAAREAEVRRLREALGKIRGVTDAGNGAEPDCGCDGCKAYRIADAALADPTA